MYRLFNLLATERCPCKKAPEAVEHILQSCELYTNVREFRWSALSTKLFGTFMDLVSTTDFIKGTGVLI
jgi:hypothetical protein